MRQNCIASHITSSLGSGSLKSTAFESTALLSYMPHATGAKSEGQEGSEKPKREGLGCWGNFSSETIACTTNTSM